MKHIIVFLLVALALGVLSAPVFAQEINLTIVSPKEGSETFAGRDIAIGVKVYESSKSDTLVVKVGSADCIEVSKADRIYKCTIEVPSTLGSATFTITAIAKWGSGPSAVTRTSTATLTLNVTNRLYPELVYPNPTGPTNLTDKKHVKAKLWFPERDRQYDISTVVPADINGEQANFVWDPAQGLFVAEYDLERLEPNADSGIAIRLLGDVSGEETFVVHPLSESETIRKISEANFWYVLGVVAVVVVLFGVWLVIRKGEKKGESARRRKARVEELGRDVKAIDRQMKDLEIELYKRRISEEEYKKRLFDYQHERRKKAEELNVLKEEEGAAKAQL